jgi:hypothetical protein
VAEVAARTRVDFHLGRVAAPALTCYGHSILSY